MMRKLRRMAAVLLSFVMLIGLFPGLNFTVEAEASNYGYGTNVLLNPTPDSGDHWEMSQCSYGKYLDMGNSDQRIIGTKTGTNISASQRVTLTDADVDRTNRGELTLEASGKFYAQGSRDLTANLNVVCYNAAGAILHTYNAKRDGYSVGGRTWTLSVGVQMIPAGTAYIVYEGTERLNMGGAYFGMYNFNMVFRDGTAPSVNTTPYLHSVNGNTALPAYVVPGDKVTYAMDFSEAVTVGVYPTLDLSIETGISYETTYSDDRKTVYFTTTLSNTGTNTDLRLKNISGLSVKDDAGNSVEYTNPGLSAGNLLYKSIFDVTNNLTNLEFSGNATVQYNTDYTATLTPPAGYQLPENITVKVNGSAVDKYDYDRAEGRIVIYKSDVTGDIEINADGVPRTYTIIFDMQGGSGGSENTAATYLQSLAAVTPPTRAGYTFGGYYTEANGAGEQYYSYDGKSNKIYDKTSDVTFYAKWSANSYTVTLDAAGGTGSGTVTAVYDSDMPEITKPVRKGYTFGGYFTQQNGGGEQYYNADAVSVKTYDKPDGLMLYAKWSANTYTVTLDMQNGSGGTASVDATYDSMMPQITPPTRSGYTFGGYYESENGAGSQYYYADGASAKAFDIDNACTLYAKWIPNTYDVVLNAQGGSGSATVTATYDSEMPVIVAPDKPGYLFGGYFSETAGGGTKYYNADCSSAKTYDQTAGIILYAVWTPIKYNIQLYSRGENVGSLYDVTYGELRLPSAESLGMSYPNYNFVGWNIYDEQNWAMYTADRTYSAGLVTEQGKTAYIYAAWLEKDKYTVTYDANGGTGAPSAVEIHVDETITLSSSAPSRENYTFIGWAEDADSATAQYQPGDSLTMGNSLVTLFALWKKNPELTYNANGGVFSTYVSSLYPAAGSQVMLTGALPQKEGYVFRGWAERETAAAADIVSSPYTMPDHDTLLYAVYEPIRYEIAVHAATGYSVAGINSDGYTYGEYAEFIVSGTNPKVYVNGVRVMPMDGKYRFEVNSPASVLISDSSLAYVIYNANGGVDAPVDMNGYASGTTAGVTMNKPVRTGYVWRGWAKESSAENAEFTGGETIPVASSDIVLYAVWEPVSYKVKYDANGGSGNMAPTVAVYDEEFEFLENTFSKTGCQFVGWSYAAGGELAYADGAKVKNLADTQDAEITLYAIWKGAKTTVRFNFEGGSSGTASCEAVYGKLLPAVNLTAPDRYGYRFAGYYTLADKGGNLVYNADMSLAGYYQSNPWDSVAATFDLYAAWEPINYTIAFVNGTETLEDTISAVYGQSFNLPSADELDIPVPEGYFFKGWSVASGSDAVYYDDGQKITTGLTGEDGKTVYLYAVIAENVSYTVTLPASGEGYRVSYGGSEIEAQTDIKVNQNEDVLFSVRVEKGYSADKITVLANGITLGATQTQENTYFYSIKNISADTNVNIYNIKKETFSVILNDGTGYSVSPKKTIVESGTDFTFTVTLLDGYKTATPVVYMNGQTVNGIKDGDVFTYTIPEVTAQPLISISVTPKPQYTITFLSNGGIYSISTVEENLEATPPTAPERYGYVFGGWYTEIDCMNPYDFQAGVKNSLSLYAKWTADTYVVEYNKNTADQVLIPDGQTKKHDIVLALSPDIPSRTGYTFIGWNTKADGAGTNYRAGGELSVNANITLYAQWKINKYAVTFIAGDGVNGTISANEVAHNGTVQVTATIAEGYHTPVITAVPQGNAELVSEGIYKITGPVSFVVSAEPKTIYTANFYHEGGLYHTQSALEGSTAAIMLPNSPEKQGHTFIGWYTEQTGGVEVNAATVLDKNISVYARFEADTFQVTPAQSRTGYTIASTDSTDITYGGNYTFTVTIAEHYNANNMRVYANGILLTGHADKNVYTYTVEDIRANIILTVEDVRADVYMVSYYVDDAVYHSQQITYNDMASVPVSPVKDGKTFQHWAWNGTEWNFARAVTEDIILKAVWAGDSFTVVPAIDGIGYEVHSTDSTSVNYGGAYTFTVTLDDHYNADTMKVYANGVLLVPDVNGTEYRFTVKNITDNITITISDVKANVYTVKYIVDGETYLSEKVRYADKAQKPKAPVKEGYIFDGWFIGNDSWDFAAVIESDLELEAKFTPRTYQVTVPENQSGFTVNTESANSVEYGENFKFNVVVTDGYNTSDMTVYANGILLEKVSEDGNTVFFEIANIKEATVITVRGIGENTYAVAYKPNTTEYVGNMPENIIKAFDGNIEISGLIPERYGYNFIGWAVAENGAVVYSAKDIYSENNDLTLYAVWEAKTFAVSFETNGGSVNSGEITEYTYGTGAVLPTDVTKEGYAFAGWYEDALLQGVRVYEIKESDYGDKKYYAAYSTGSVVVNGYTGEYDGKAHNITYTLTDNLSVEKYQWYFVPDGASERIAVQSESYNTYGVKDVTDSGEYYCYLECLVDGYVIRFFTEKTTVSITKKPVSVKAADSGKVYDAQPLTADKIELTAGTHLADGHTMSAVMTAESSITKVGTQPNVIEQLTISDSENKNVTENYEITKQNGMLTVTPLTLQVVAENVTILKGSVLDESRLYKLSGMLGNEKLSLANISVTVKNASNEEVAFADITKNIGKYTVTIHFNGFDGAGGENYQGGGTFTSNVTVYKQSGGSSGGSGGGGFVSTYTVKFDTNGAGEIDSQRVRSNGTVIKPDTPEKAGYVFDGWFTDEGLSTAYDFETKVTKSFTLYAKWKKSGEGNTGNCKGTAAEHCPSLAFRDLDVHEWYHLDVDYVLENEIMKGTDTDEFSPNGALTRAMLVTILYRTEHEPEISAAATFKDVKAGAYYEDAVRWAQANGIVKGYSETEFCPDENIIREQIAAIMYRYAQYKGYDVSAGENTNILSYADAQMVSEYAIPAVQYAVGSGLLQGDTEKYLNPQENATRAEFAAILHRFVFANK